MAAITTDGDPRRDVVPLTRRLLWFAALWLLGVATITLVGAAIRAVVF